LCDQGFAPGRWALLSNALKSQINAAANTLDQYNNGNLSGVPHCA
jgi:hypothetical protein